MLMRNSKLEIGYADEYAQSIAHKLKRIREQDQFRIERLDQFNSLTKREVEVMTLAVIGYKNPHIAELLYISRRTVEQHRKNINRKLQIKSFSVLVQYALAFDLV